jgi:hypothetical protein
MLIITTNFPKGFFLTFLGFGRFIIMIYLFVLRASLLDYGIVGKILDSSRDLSRYSDSYTFWCVMLWRGSRSTAYIGFEYCAFLGPAFVGVVKAIKPLPQQYEGYKRNSMIARKTTLMDVGG